MNTSARKLAIAALLSAASVCAQPPKSLQTFLEGFDANLKERFTAALVDLNGDGKQEAIVYLRRGDWCGSAGCTTLILTPDGGTWKLVTKVTITNPPIRVLTTTSNGWRNIGVRVEGGGIRPGYEAELAFNGKTYPGNPSVAPAKRAAEGTRGETVITDPPR